MADSVIDKAIQQLFKDGVKIVELWRNASPDSDFTAQSLNIHAERDLTVIQFGSSSEGNKNGLYTYEIGDSGMSYGSGSVCTEREVTVSPTQITFGPGYGASANGWVVNNAYLKPLIIYGIKILAGGGSKFINRLRSLFSLRGRRRVVCL